MNFLSWNRPSQEDQSLCIKKSGLLNYDSNFIGASANFASTLKQDKQLANNGFLVNHARVLVGSGVETFEKGKSALKNWKHFNLNWAFVDQKTPVKKGTKFCVCTKALMPLEVAYVNEQRMPGKAVSSFSFGSGTLVGR